MAAQNLPSSSKSCWNHDVFLSFRGEDTRKNFTDHLYSALVRAGIRTFRDDEEIRTGMNISEEIINAIRGSRISIVVFSKGYASSRWCLDELVEILNCTKTRGHLLLPLFYHVKSADVRKQEGTFAEAFIRHEERFQADMERVQGWKAALTEVADYSGWDLESLANGYESTFIKKIVEEVFCKVNPGRLNVAMHPIGIHSRVEEMKALLNLETNEVRIVGIYGMGGIGKTTLAKAVYNQIYDGFEGSSCLLNIKEVSEQPNGLVHLQKQFLSDILKMNNLKIDNVDGGITLIKERIQGKRVLIVLDDVDNLKQLQALAGNFEWFGSGSRVIATTRDEHLLTKLGASEKYKVEELDGLESLQLFSCHAFDMTHPIEDFLELSMSAVKYAGGLPLALEVLGSFLFKRSIVEWKAELGKLLKTPHNEIQKILRTSFDSLDYNTKDIFLDIACFFIDMDKEYAIKILHDCGFFPDIGISILIQRSLITIDYKNKLRVHNLIRDMGREIVRERSSGDLRKRSRLWFHEDVLNVLSKHMGLILNLSVHLKTEAFANMKNLRLLQISSVYLTGCYKHLSKELRWLCWHNCPLKLLPRDFHLDNLVVLDMQHSSVKQMWKKNKILNKLKVLNLSNSKSLRKSPNFVQFPHLEVLILEACTSLVEVNESIGQLKGLVLLNLKGCKNLRNLPGSISNLKSLETLNLAGCLKLDKLPEHLGNMLALTELLLEETAIKQLPSSFGLLKNLKTVSLSGSKGQSSNSWLSGFSSRLSTKSSNPLSLLPASVHGLFYLTKLNLSDSNLSEDGIPIDFGSLSSLKYLDLSGNNFRSLPHCISCLPQLNSLWLHDCESLQSIFGLPATLEYLNVDSCTSMERFSILSNLKRSLYLSITNCHKLVEIQGLEIQSLESLSIIDMQGCNNLSYEFRQSLLQCPSKIGGDLFIGLPGSEIPNWCNHQRIGSSISFHVPSEGQIHGLLVCAVFAAMRHKILTLAEVMINNKTRGYECIVDRKFYDHLITIEDHLFVWHIPVIRNELEMQSGEEIEVSITFMGPPIKVEKCGILLLVDKLHDR